MATPHIPLRIPLTQARAREIFSYDPESGILTWRERGRCGFPNITQQRSWNAKYAGKPAGTKHHRGYIAIRYSGRFYLAHRIVWLYVYGYWPNVTDHINRIRDDNRICNLRDVTQSENMQNINRHAGASNARGVSFIRATNRWRAYYYNHYRQVHVGTFDSEKAAIEGLRKAKP